MNLKCKAKTLEGKEVEGWCCGIDKRCWIVPRPELDESDDMRETRCSIFGFIEIDPETVELLPCKTCRGSGVIKKKAKYWGESPLVKSIPCPDCPQPTSEFVKSYSRLLDNVVIAFATTDDFKKIIQQQVTVDWGRKALDIIVRQQKRIDELEVKKGGK